MSRTAGRSRDLSDLGKFQQKFWERYQERTGEGRPGLAANHQSFETANPDFKVVQFLGREEEGVFVKSASGSRMDETADHLASRIGASRERNERKFSYKRLPMDMADAANWDRAVDWLKVQADLYIDAIAKLPNDQSTRSS